MLPGSGDPVAWVITVHLGRTPARRNHLGGHAWTACRPPETGQDPIGGTYTVDQPPSPNQVVSFPKAGLASK